MTSRDPDASIVPDEELVRRVLCGDRDAYEVLVRRHQGKIVAFVQRMVVDRDAALDVAQETFIKAWQHLARFDPKWRFTTWLYTIANNSAIDWLRARKRLPLSLDQPVLIDGDEVAREPVDELQSSAADMLSAKEMQQHLEAAIAELPPGFRELLLLRHPGGRSYDEIAEITKLPLGTVKNRIFRARQALKDRLGALLPADV
jgi:RNA polymerase sigma-70 factor (ECF subfamily)